MEYLDEAQRHDIDLKVEALHEHWLRLKNILERRLELASLYCRFFNEANTLNKEMDTLEDQVRNAPQDVREDVMNKLEENWSSLVPLYQQAKNTGLNFISQGKEVSYLFQIFNVDKFVELFTNTNKCSLTLFLCRTS